MPKKKLTRDRLRQIIREEKAKLDRVDEADERVLQLQEKLTERLMDLKEKLDRNGVHDISNEARYKLTEDGLKKFIRKVERVNSQIHQAINL